MKSDARVRYTKMVIKSSFIELLKQRPLNKVTVKDVCALAEINRATFYKHYADCFDLMSKLEDELISELQQMMQKSEYTNAKILFTEMFRKIKDNSEVYITLSSENGDKSFPSRIISLCYEQADHSARLQLSHVPMEQREWLYYFSAHGCSGVLGHWISTGMQADATQIAAFIDNALRKIRTP